MAIAQISKITLALALGLCSAAASASTLIVIDSRAPGLKAGQKIDSNTPITLKEGERVTVIGPDGKSITLRGKFSGLPLGKTPVASDPGRALAALINTRNARTSSVGVVRGATDAAALPDPWLIDISRAGERCLKAGGKPIWWRPDAKQSQKFTVLPVDRSWVADFEWNAGESMMAVPELAAFDSQTIFVMRVEDQEFPVSINIVPSDLENDLILASWMLEKGCTQQADALLKTVGQNQAVSK
ncbi:MULTISPECIES: hypothetical protein [unclassified Sphingomonas]|uniref:hypothetical protein n=1 Tax=unclassified Sphingomonas TaxID=196159 RepID=UPI000BD0DBEB|nr:MAG: hypothetical protein B7Y98_11050 [Sphingomonas sp. 32-62-10]